MHLSPRVLVVGKLPPLQGGTAISTLEAANALHAEGLLVGVVTAATNGPIWTRCVLGAPSPVHFPVVDASVAEEPSHIPEYPMVAQRVFGATIEACNLLKPDLILGWYYEPFGRAAALAGRCLGIRVAVMHAGSDLFRLANDRAINQSFSVAFTGTKLLSTAPASQRVKELFGQDPIVVPAHRPATTVAQFDFAQSVEITPELRSQMLSALPQEVAAAIEGKLGSPKPTGEESCSYLIYGKASRPKRILEVLEAFKGIADKDVRLTIMTGGTQHHMANLAKALQAYDDPRTVISPFAQQSLVGEIVRAHHAVFVLESNHDVPRHPSTLPLEVLAAGGLLVISEDLRKRVSIGKNLVNHRTCIVVQNPDNPAEILDAMNFAKDQTEAAARIRAAGQMMADSLRRLVPMNNPWPALMGAI